MNIITMNQMTLSLLEIHHADLARDYFLRNKDHVASTMPRFSADFFEKSYWENRLAKNIIEYKNDQSLRLFLSLANDPKVIGSINFTEIQRGVFQGCFLGYSIDKAYQGKGLMTKALKISIEYVFKELNLHKILANYMPSNPKSGRVLEKLGFHQVGLAKQELFLNGKWQDHMETRLINSHWKNTIV